MFAGSPAEVTDRIPANHEIFGCDRFLVQMGIDAYGDGHLMRTIELFGTKVAPEVRQAATAAAPPARSA